MDTTIFSLGGSLIAPDMIDTGFLAEFREMIMGYSEKGRRAVIVCGGGKTCRRYVEAADEITGSRISSTDKDWIGIKATRLNAELVRAMFGKDAHEKVIDNPEDPIETEKKIIIGAGYLPGHSSDMDAVLLAMNFGAKKVINMSNIDYVYDKSPKEHRDARPIRDMSFADLYMITGTEWTPSMNSPFDPIAAKKAEDAGISIIVLNGKNIDNLKRCIEGVGFEGTVISQGSAQ